MNKNHSKMILNHQKILFTPVVVFAFLFASCLVFGVAKCNLTPPPVRTHTKKKHACARTRMQLAMIVRCGIFASTIAVLMGSVAVEAGKSGSVQRVQHACICAWMWYAVFI
jgi:hypothetical protein